MNLFIVKLLVIILSITNLKSMTSVRGEKHRLSTNVVDEKEIANRTYVRESAAIFRKLGDTIQKTKFLDQGTGNILPGPWHKCIKTTLFLQSNEQQLGFFHKVFDQKQDTSMFNNLANYLKKKLLTRTIKSIQNYQIIGHMMITFNPSCGNMCFAKMETSRCNM